MIIKLVLSLKLAEVLKTNGCHREHHATSCAGSITEPVMEDKTRRGDTTFLRPPFYIVRFVDLRFNCSQRKKKKCVRYGTTYLRGHRIARGARYFQESSLIVIIFFSTRRHLAAKAFNTTQNKCGIDLKNNTASEMAGPKGVWWSSDWKGNWI